MNNWKPVADKLCGQDNPFIGNPVDYLDELLERLRAAEARLDALTGLEAISARLDAAQGADDLDRRAEQAEVQLRAEQRLRAEDAAKLLDTEAQLRAAEARVRATDEALAGLEQEMRQWSQIYQENGDDQGELVTTLRVWADTIHALRTGEGRP